MWQHLGNTAPNSPRFWREGEEMGLGEWRAWERRKRRPCRSQGPTLFQRGASLASRLYCRHVARMLQLLPEKALPHSAGEQPKILFSTSRNLEQFVVHFPRQHVGCLRPCRCTFLSMDSRSKAATMQTLLYLSSCKIQSCSLTGNKICWTTMFCSDLHLFYVGPDPDPDPLALVTDLLPSKTLRYVGGHINHGSIKS